jgi:hypothetical protein
LHEDINPAAAPTAEILTLAAEATAKKCRRVGFASPSECAIAVHPQRLWSKH